MSVEIYPMPLGAALRVWKKLEVEMWEKLTDEERSKVLVWVMKDNAKKAFIRAFDACWRE